MSRRFEDERHERYRGRAVRREHADGLPEALEAMSAEELRAFIVDALKRLDDGPRADLEDVLLRHAARSRSGWKPAAPASALVEEVEAFVEAARRVGKADPSDVDRYLRQGITASLAGDHATARAILAALLAPITDGEIDLGQRELVDEILSVELHECAVRYVTAVYVTTPPAERAGAVLEAVERVRELSHLNDPIEAISDTLSSPPPDLEDFLPVWIERLEREPPSASAWESDHERWLRTAVGRRDGVAGLERIARASKRAEAVRAWCGALVAEGDWARALEAYEDAATFVTSDYARGDCLDRAALAAQVLGRRGVPKKLAAAWLGAPSLLRLARWLFAGEPSTSALRRRAATALATSPTKAPRILALLHVLLGEIEPAAKLLSEAPGLGWSRSDHPGHILFPGFSWLLGGSPTGSVREGLAQPLNQPLDDREPGLIPSVTEGDGGPRLPQPSVLDLMRRADVMARLTRGDRIAMLTAMKAAAVRRTDGVLAEKRRRHYGHAAALIACCVELEDGSGAPGATSRWADELRAKTSRFPAFQGELRAALSLAPPGTRLT